MSSETPRFGAPGTTEGMLDVLASEARTALDDPEYYDITDQAKAQALAIDRLDDIISTLNPGEDTRETFAYTLKVLGRHIADRQDAIEANELSYEDHDDETKAAYAEAYEALTLALDYLDTAIGALAPEGT